MTDRDGLVERAKCAVDAIPTRRSGPPWSRWNYVRRVDVYDAIDAALSGTGEPDTAPESDVERLARAYVTAKRAFDKKWHQDNCPERGDFHRWYADKARAWNVLDAKFDALEAALQAERKQG